MDLHHLEHFLAVVDEGTFTRAAVRLLRTQSAISQSIKRLEDQIGTPLFARDRTEIKLTEAGHRLRDYAIRLLRLRDQAVRDLAGLHDLASGTLAIAAHESAALYLLPKVLGTYVHRFPDVKIGLYRSRLDEIPRQVLEREVDLGFVAADPGYNELEALQVGADQLILIAPPGHPVVRQRLVRIPDLGREHFVVHHLCQSTVSKIREVFDQHNTTFRTAAELWSFENVKDFVQQDVGLAIVPRTTVAKELRQGTLVEVPVEGLDIPRKTLVVFRDRRYLSDAARGLLALLEPPPSHAVLAPAGDVELLDRALSGERS